MKVIVFVLLIQLVFAQNDYNFLFKNSLLCKPWNCISDQLGITTNTLPEKGEFLTQLESLLPEDWKPVAKDVVSVCYGVRTRMYTNTCRGQALLHCVVDNLISHCPEKYHRKEDACAPLTSLAGFKYMFSQSCYENLETNLPADRRPVWFLKNYFSTKRCEIPELLNKTTLSKCGFNDNIHIYSHLLKPKQGHLPQPAKKTQQLQEVHKHFTTEDPLDCCDIEDFLPHSTRAKCLFETFWNDEQRLTIRNRNPGLAPLPTHKPYSGFRRIEPQKFDVKVVPLSCQTETCIFKKLNILKDDNTVDEASFSKLLDSFTDKHPEWSSAKARVVTTCLARKRQGYEGECDVNTLLACTFDVLSENCPRTPELVSDPCKHTHTSENGTICQISTSKYRPKNRRQFCELPELVSADILNQCGVRTIAKEENVPVLNRASIWRQNLYRKFSWFSMPLPCQDTYASTSCAMNDLGILNKYNFLDYFKMKEHIREFSTKQPEWHAFMDVILGLYSVTPLYKEHCTSQRKMLNVLDGLLMTCPISKRKDTPMCNKMFADIMKNTSFTPDATTPKFYHHHNQIPSDHKTGPRKHSHAKKLPPITKLFDANTAPAVEIISIKPQILHEERRPLTILPVYKKEQPKIKEPPSTPLSAHLEPQLGPMRPGFGPPKTYGPVGNPISVQKPSFSPYSDLWGPALVDNMEPPSTPLSAHLEPQSGPMRPGFGPSKTYGPVGNPIPGQKPSVLPYSDLWGPALVDNKEPPSTPLSTHLEPQLVPMRPGFGPSKTYGPVGNPILVQKPSFSPYSDPFLRSAKPDGAILEDDENRID